METPASPASAPNQNVLAASGRRILVVDDETIARLVTAKFLEKAGYSVIQADGGRAAVAQVNSGSFDCVLLDMSMPDLDGLGVLAAIRAKHNQGELPVIMVTGNDSPDDIVNALELGANDYVTKPLDYSIVMARVKTQVDRRSAELAMRESEERLALAIAGSQDGVWDWDLRTNKIYFSPRWMSLHGYAADEPADSIEAWLNIVHPADIGKLRGELSNHISGITLNFQCEYRVRHKSGVYRWLMTRGTSNRDPSGQSTRLAGSATDITHQKVLDPLTGLPNRLQFTDRIDAALQRSKRRDDADFSLLLISLDHFDAVRRSHGQATSESLLVASAGRMLACMRPTDSIAMLGENLFGVLIEDPRGADGALRVLERIRQEMRRPFDIHSEDLFVTVRAGILPTGRAYEGATDVMRDATVALGHAEEDAHRVFDAEMHARAMRRLRMEANLRRAIEADQFVLYYQPICALPSGDLSGFEALIRWVHPEQGMIPPGEFIPLAEENNMIVPIGLWAMRRAAEQHKIWADAGHSDLFITINVSGKQLAHPGFIESVKGVLAETGVNPRGLKLEITESTVMSDVELMVSLLKQLKDLGLRLAMDDFGTGHSSLGLLHRLPLDTIKVDRSFVIKMGEDEDGVKIVRTILALAHGLGKDVVSEGVETKDQADKLIELGSEYVQGYYFSRPLTAEAAAVCLGATLPLPAQVKAAM